MDPDLMEWCFEFLTGIALAYWGVELYERYVAGYTPERENDK